MNCIVPGVLNTKMLEEILCAGIARVGTTEYEKVRKLGAGGLISAVWDPWRNLHNHIEDLQNTDVYTLTRIVPEERGKAWGSA